MLILMRDTSLTVCFEPNVPSCCFECYPNCLSWILFFINYTTTPAMPPRSRLRQSFADSSSDSTITLSPQTPALFLSALELRRDAIRASGLASPDESDTADEEEEHVGKLRQRVKSILETCNYDPSDGRWTLLGRTLRLHSTLGGPRYATFFTLACIMSQTCVAG